MTFCCKNLAIKDILSRKSDPFLVFRAKSNNGIVIHKTEYIAANLNPTFAPIKLFTDDCGGFDAPIFVQCFDYDSDGGHDYIGYFQTSLRLLSLAAANQIEFQFKRDDSAKPQGKCHLGKYCELQEVNKIPVSYDVQLECEKVSDLDAFLVVKGVPSYPNLYPTSKPRPPFITQSVVIHKTDHQKKKEKNATFDPFRLDVASFGGIDNTVEIELWNFNENGLHELIGATQLTLREMGSGSNVPFKFGLCWKGFQE